MISKLGLRCEPTGNFDRDAYAAKVAMLADDVSDLPTDLLDKAINKLVASSPYLPKASDLRQACRDAITPRPQTDADIESKCRAATAKLHEHRKDMLDHCWTHINGQYVIRPIEARPHP